MNRIVLIGNGFDLAHGLKTKYEDFINWYWDHLATRFRQNKFPVDDNLVDIAIGERFRAEALFNHIMRLQDFDGSKFKELVINNGIAFSCSYTPFFKNIITSIETKGWVDIENEYYCLLKDYATKGLEKETKTLNTGLHCLQDLLVEYLNEISKHKVEPIELIKKEIYEPITIKDVSIAAKDVWADSIHEWKNRNLEEWRIKLYDYGVRTDPDQNKLLSEAVKYKKTQDKLKVPVLFQLPDKIMLLSFNYTTTARQYLQQDSQVFSLNYIHGQLNQPDSIIFGHGDEMDEHFKEIQNLNNEEYLKNIKSINYMKSNNYREVLSFIESAPYQITIMGHSCGNSDRTLLNTLFEHDNCISIKPFYHVKEDGSDNYLELVQNISRNFKDMKLMRDRVVNKTYCEPMSKK